HHLPARISPAVPQASEGKERIILQAEVERLLGILRPLPLVKPIGGNQAAASFERLPERGLAGYNLRPSVDQPVADAKVLRPVRDQTPACERETALWLRRVLTNDRDALRWSDVVPRLPIHLVGGVEILLDQLLASG